MTELTLTSQDLGHTADVSGVEQSSASGVGRTRLSRPVSALRAIPHLATYAGVVLAAAGAGLLVIAWGRTAALTSVALQVPYVVSAGFTGLGLVAVGLTVINVSSKHADARGRSQQISELRDLLAELRATIEEEQS